MWHPTCDNDNTLETWVWGHVHTVPLLAKLPLHQVRFAWVNNRPGLKVTPCSLRITSITHNLIPVIGEVMLKIKCRKLVYHKFIIVPDRYMTVPVLMGADLLSRRKFYWNAEKGIINRGGQIYKQQTYELSSSMCRSVEVFKIEVKNIFYK